MYLSDKLSAVKERTDLEWERLRVLMFQATSFLHSMLQAIDYQKLTEPNHHTGRQR